MQIIKTLIFHILLQVRPLVLIASRLCILVFLGTLTLLYCRDDAPRVPLVAKTMLLVFGLAGLAVYWFYDYLILYLKPKMLDLVLYK